MPAEIRHSKKKIALLKIFSELFSNFVIQCIRNGEGTSLVDHTGQQGMARSLSSRQVIAVREYLKGRTKSEALRIAGYSESIATTRPQHVFDNPKVQAEIARRQEVEEKKAAVTVEWLREKMMEIIEKPGAKDGDKLRALEMLGRNIGMFLDRLEITDKEALVEKLHRGRDRIAKNKEQDGAEDG